MNAKLNFQKTKYSVLILLKYKFIKQIKIDKTNFERHSIDHRIEKFLSYLPNILFTDDLYGYNCFIKKYSNQRFWERQMVYGFINFWTNFCFVFALEGLISWK